MPDRRQLEAGDNPALCYCRICGAQAVPPFEGYYLVGVCSVECYEEHKWRNVLHMLKKPYQRRQEKP